MRMSMRGKFRRPVLEADGAPVQFARQCHGALVGAVGNEDAARAAAEQGARRFLARVARADDHDRMFAQAS